MCHAKRAVEQDRHHQRNVGKPFKEAHQPPIPAQVRAEPEKPTDSDDFLRFQGFPVERKEDGNQADEAEIGPAKPAKPEEIQG